MTGRERDDWSDYTDFDDEDDGSGVNDNGDPRNPINPTPGSLVPIEADPPLIEREISKNP